MSSATLSRSFFAGAVRIGLICALLAAGLNACPPPAAAATWPVTAGTGDDVIIPDNTIDHNIATGPAIDSTGGTITGNNTQITVVGGTGPAVSAQGTEASVSLTGSSTSIAAGSGNTASSVILAGNSGRITMEGTVSTNDSATHEQTALTSGGTGSLITLRNGTVNASYIGLEMTNGGWIELDGDNTVNLSGHESGSLGVYVHGSSPPSTTPISNLTVNINDTQNQAGDQALMGVLVRGQDSSAVFDTLTVTGDDAHIGGLAFDGGALTVNNGVITINGLIPGEDLYVNLIDRFFVKQKAMGLFALEGSSVTAADTEITINVTNTGDIVAESYGVYARGSSSLNLTGGSVSVNGDGSSQNEIYNVGIFVIDDSDGTIENTKVSTDGENTVGIWAGEESRLSVNGAEVSTSGADSNAVRVEGKSSAVLENNTLSSTGASSFGLFALDSSTLTDNGSSVTVEGANSAGVVVNGNSLVDLTGTSITVTGSDAYGAWLIGDTPRLRLTDVALQSDGPGVVLEGTNASLEMAGGTLVSSNTAFVSYGQGNRLTVSSGAEVRPENNLTLYVGNGDATLSASDNALLLGGMRAASGANATVNLDTGAAWTGAAENIGALTMMGASLWNITADSDVASFRLENSTAAFAPPQAGAFKTLTVRGDYQGQNGLVSLNTYLGDSSSPSDLLSIQGNSLGQTGLLIVQAGGNGALTTGDGIKVVEVAGDSDGEFTLANRLVSAGVYEYRLYRGLTSDTDGNWYLRSTLQPDPPDPADPSDPPAPDPVLKPDIRHEVPLAGAIPSLAHEYGFAMADNLHKREGELFPPASEPSGGGRTLRTWTRLLGSHGHMDRGKGPDNGPRYDYTLKGIQIGLDVALGDETAKPDASDKAGLYLGYGRISSDVDGVWRGKAGEVDLDAYSLGLYWTHRGQRPWYTDLVLQGSLYRADAQSVHGEDFKTRGQGVLGSLEGGYAFELGQGLSLEPQAQMIWQFVSMDRARDNYGTFVYQDGDSLRGRLGARMVKLWDTGSAGEPQYLSTWLRGNVWHEFRGDQKYRVTPRSGEQSTTFKAPLDGTWWEAELGLAGQVSDSVTLFATGAYARSMDGNDRRGWEGRVGVRIRW